MLKKNLVRDGQNRLIGSVTTGFADGSSIVRDAEGGLLGKLQRNSTTHAMPEANWSVPTRRMPASSSVTMTNRFWPESLA